jgi:hypothetical protein
MIVSRIPFNTAENNYWKVAVDRNLAQTAHSYNSSSANSLCGEISIHKKISR